MDTLSFVQQIKQKQEQFKNNLKGAYPQHRREQSAPEPLLNVFPPVQSFHSTPTPTPAPNLQEMSLHQSSPYPRNNQTPNQSRTKLENDTSASPLIFRTPHVSLHQHQINMGGLRYNMDQSETRGREQKEVSQKTKHVDMGRQLQRSQIKGNVVEAAPNYVNELNNHEHQQEIHDYQIVLEEVMKKYRLLQTDLNQKNREIQKTEFYKKELAKERSKSYAKEQDSYDDGTGDGPQHPRGRVCVRLGGGAKEQQISLAVQNQALRNLLCLDSPAVAPQLVDEVELETTLTYLPEQNQEAVDKLLNIMIQELNVIKIETKQKASQNNRLFNAQNLTLTVMNRQNMIDLEEEKLLTQPLQLSVRFQDDLS